MYFRALAFEKPSYTFGFFMLVNKVQVADPLFASHDALAE